MNPINLLDHFRKRPSDAAEDAEKWIQDVKLRRGFSEFEAGKKKYVEKCYKEALGCFDTAIRCGFEDRNLFALRGGCLDALEWHLDAIEDFTRAISLQPHDCNLYYQRSMAKHAIGDKEGWIADLREARRLSKADTPLNSIYNLEIKDKGWESVTNFYESQGMILWRTPDSMNEENRERAKLRGRRMV